jgi:hypothetical protein
MSLFLEGLPAERLAVARMVSSADVDVCVDYGLFGVHDSAVMEDPPIPHKIGHPWLSVGTSYLLFESAEDIYLARLKFELRDEQPYPLQQPQWPQSESARMQLPSGDLSVHQITAGSLRDVFRVGEPGRYAVRLAWRHDASVTDRLAPQTFVLAQFWRDPVH